MSELLHATTSSGTLSEDEVITADNDSFVEATGSQDVMGFPPTLLVSFTIILATLLVVGVAGNVLVIVVLIRAQWHARRSLVATTSTTNAYILNLSAADLLFLVFCAPFHGTVYILNHWPFGWVMCKLAHYCQFCTVYASIWILTTMSVDRYVAIGHPLKSVKWRHPTQATRISGIMWTMAALVSVPWLVLYETDEYETEDGATRIACYDAWSDTTYHYRKWMILFGFLIGFLIPSVVIFCMALLIAKSIRLATHQPLLRNGSEGVAWTKSDAEAGGDGGRLKRRRRVGWLVFALSLVFFICWGPHNFSLVWLNFDSSALDWITDHYQAFFIMKLVAHMMTYVNSSINPLLYSIGSNQFYGRLAATCGLRTRSPTAATSNCRTFGNRTLLANSTLIQPPVSRSSSVANFSKRDSSNSLNVGRQKPAAPLSPLVDVQKRTINGVSNTDVYRATVIPSSTRPKPKVSSTRKPSSAFTLIRQNKNSFGISSCQDAVPLISRRLAEVKRTTHFVTKLSTSSGSSARADTISESTIIANPHAVNGSAPVSGI